MRGVAFDRICDGRCVCRAALAASQAGMLLPSATVFLLLLCNDKAVLGLRKNTRA